MLNGDLITGENTFKENSTTYVDQIVGPLVERNLTWASTYGNHDNDFNLTGEGILERESLWPNSRTRSMVPGPDAGVTNYYLPVYPANCTLSAAATPPCSPELILWFFDSRGGHRYQEVDAEGNPVGLQNWVDTSVVNWFQQTNAELVSLNGNRVIPSLAFVHIPANASQALQTKAGVDPSRQPGINDDYPLAAQGQGWCADGTTNDGTCDYGAQDVPFMQAITTTKGLMAVFSGHDHGKLRFPRYRRSGLKLTQCSGDSRQHVVLQVGRRAARHDGRRQRAERVLRAALGLWRVRQLDQGFEADHGDPGAAEGFGRRHLDPDRGRNGGWLRVLELHLRDGLVPCDAKQHDILSYL